MVPQQPEATWHAKLGWYIVRPQFYPYLVESFMRRLKGRLYPVAYGRQLQPVDAWCRENVVSRQEAFLQLTGKAEERPFDTLFESELASAHETVRQCPVQMGGAADLSLIYNLAEYLHATRVIETGVAYGWSSLALLLSLKNRSGALLVSTDMPYPALGGEQYVGCVVPDSLRQSWQIIRLPDHQGIPRALHQFVECVHLVHYDSEKSYEGRRWAYPKLWQAICPNGILVSDDIGDNAAFQEFCEAVGREPIILEGDEKFVGILVKQ